MLQRTLFSQSHNLFRETAARFVDEHIAPHHAQWEKDGQISREAWLEAGRAGLLCCSVPEEFGGPGADFLYGTIVMEELSRVGATGPGFGLHSDIVCPYIMHYGTADQKKHWLPRMVSGEAIGAIAMTEPGAGSDLQSIQTRARVEDDHFVISGQKVFITNGQMCDFVIVACKTNPAEGAKGVSLILVETNREGFRRGRNLEKIGWKAQDTSELFFDDVRVPKENLLGTEGNGFGQLMEQLAQERLIQAIKCTSTLEAALQWTCDYVQERQAFGRPIAAFQNTRFSLANVKAQTTMLRVFVDRCIEVHRCCRRK